MSYSKHVPNLMNHCPYRRIENHLPVNLLFLSAGILMIPSNKWKDSDSCLVGCPAIYVIPVGARIQILEGYAHDTISILWYASLHKSQDVIANKLLSVNVISFSDVWNGLNQIFLRKNFHQCIRVECLAEHDQFLHEQLVESTKW